jgi:hypothetical protein
MSNNGLNIGTQFVTLPRAQIRSGLLGIIFATLPHECLTPLLVLMFLARARPEGAFVTMATLQETCRVDNAATLGRMLALLEGVHAIDVLQPSSPSLLRFTVNRALYAAQGHKFYILPGTLITSGVWGSVSPDARAVLWCLAALAKPEVWDVDSEFEDEHCAAWISSLESENAIYSYDKIRRLGFTTLQELNDMTGIARDGVVTAVNALTSIGDPEVVLVYPASDGFWFHLPESMWGRQARKP